MKQQIKLNPLQLLKRTDKWYVGGGNRLLWAPPFPVHLDSPGFWDSAHYYNYELEPLFTWALLTNRGDLLSLRFLSLEWRPDHLIQRYECSSKEEGISLSVTERKSILPSDVAVSVLHIRNRSRKRASINLVAWNVRRQDPQKQTSWIEDVQPINKIISFRQFLRQGVSPALEMATAFGLSPQPTSWSVNLSERTAVQPRWELTPFVELFNRRRLPNRLHLTGSSSDGLIYFCLHTELAIPSHSEDSVTVALAVGSTIEEVRKNLKPVLRHQHPVELSSLNWSDYFQSLPTLKCSDEYITTYFAYRWYGLRLNTIFGNEGNYRHPVVCEGIHYFRAPISYSAPCHMMETKWMHEADLARGSLATFLDNQRKDGGFRGYIDVHHYRQEMFYHAHWGAALYQLHLLHPSKEYFEEVYDGMKRLAGYYDRERDEEVSGLYDIDNHFETGQEFMHRYLVVDPRADQENWGEVFRLKGVDVTIYVYELKRVLAFAADVLGRSDEAELWMLEANKIKDAVLTTMWDPKQEMFFDVNPKTGERTNVKATTCFYPYFTDIVDESHLSGLKKHLFNKREFWTPFPFPSSSVDDPYFSAAPTWKGKRMNCPWNGRVWPMTNSHLAEAIATSAIRFNDRDLRSRFVQFLMSYIRMMFFDRDPRRPNCFEHYNPFTGAPSAYRGIDDYQHSWVNDLIIKYVCGVRPDIFTVTIDPFPFGLQHLRIDKVQIRGRRIEVEITGNRFTVALDGKHHATSTIGRSIVLQI
jgi:hypothetical protein